MDRTGLGESSRSASPSSTHVRAFVPHVGRRPIRILDLWDCYDCATALQFRLGQGVQGDQVSVHHLSDCALNREQCQLVCHGGGLA